MNIVEFVGIIILECPRCKQRYVVDTVALQCGFEHRCTCGLVEKTLYKAKYAMQPTFGVRDCMFDPKDKSDVSIKKAYESSLKQSQAVPLEEYKAMLADYVLNGKVKKVPKQYKNSVNFPDDKQYQDMLETLLSLGYKRQDAISKIQIALEQGIRMEQDLIKYILDL